MNDFASKNYPIIRATELIVCAILFTLLLIPFEKSSGIGMIIATLAGLNGISYLLLAKVPIEFENSDAHNTLGTVGMMNFVLKLNYFGFIPIMITLVFNGLNLKIDKTITLWIVSALLLIACLILSLLSRNEKRTQYFDIFFYARIVAGISYCLFFLMNTPNNG